MSSPSVMKTNRRRLGCPPPPPNTHRPCLPSALLEEATVCWLASTSAFVGRSCFSSAARCRERVRVFCGGWGAGVVGEERA